jgi:O-antigen/teichoic acid export membrane protein
MSSLRQLAIQFGHFFSGSALSMLLGLLTFPILTRLLSQAEYGMLGIVTTTVSLAVVAAKGGLSDGIVRFLRDYNDDPERRIVFTSTVVVRGVILAAIVTAAYLLLIPHILPRMGVDNVFLSAFLVMALYLFTRPLNIIVYNYLRALQHSLLYNAIGLAGRVAGVALALGLLVFFTHALWGYFLGLALAEAAVTVVLFTWLLRHYQLRIGTVSSALSWQLVRFGLPLLATELMYLLLRSGDRYLIQYYLGDSAVGVYSVGYTLPSYINDLVMFSLSYAVVPIYVELFGKEGPAATSEFLGRALRYYIMGMIVLCAGFAAIATDLIVVLASDKYRESAAFSPWILLGLALLGATTILNAGLYLQKRTVQMLLIMAAGLIANFATNIALLPLLGVQGGAYATLVAGIVMAVLTVALSFRHLPIGLDWRSAALYVVVLGVPLWLLGLVETGSHWLNLVVKVGLGAALTAGIVLWREPEVRALAQRLRGRLRR